MNAVDFYLASTDSLALEEPRRCTVIKRLQAQNRDDYLLVEIDPPLTGPPRALGDRDPGRVIVATHLSGDTLFPINRWPMPVYVCRMLVPYQDQDAVRGGELECIAWGELYENENAARDKLM